MTGFGLRKKLRVAGYRLLGSVEPLISKPRSGIHPPTFIIGSPRSGTTLVALAIVKAFSRSYFSRIAVSLCLVNGSPKPEISSRVTCLATRLIPGNSRFENRYGNSRRITAPTESEIIWDTLFGTKYDAVDPASISRSQRDAIEQVVAATENGFGGRPFVDKATTASVRIEALRAIFPDAIFIRVARDRMSVAQSIVIARQRLRFQDWIGARPRQCLGMQNESVERQACTQIHYTEQGIDEAIKSAGEDNFLTIRYSDLCADPNRQIRRAGAFFAAHGIPGESDGLEVDSFIESRGQKVSDAQYASIAAEFARLDQLGTAEPKA